MPLYQSQVLPASPKDAPRPAPLSPAALPPSNEECSNHPQQPEPERCVPVKCCYLASTLPIATAETAAFVAQLADLQDVLAVSQFRRRAACQTERQAIVTV